MTKTLTCLVFFLTMFVSVSAFADFSFSQNGRQNENGGPCYQTHAQVCAASGLPVTGGSSCGTSLQSKGCILSTPSNATCLNGICTCNTGYKENTSSVTNTSCELTSQWSEILGIAIGLGIAAAGAAAAAAVCGTVALVGCASAVATALLGAGIAATAIYNGSDPKPDPVKPTTMNITLAPQSADNSKPTGVHRDHQGNLRPTGTGWTQNGDTHTKTSTDGTTTSTTTVNTKTDTAVHTITNSATGQTSKTVVSGSGGSGGGSGGGTATGGAPSGAGIVTENKNADGSSTTTTIKTDTDGNPTDVSVITCNAAGSCTVTTPSNGGSSGGGSGGSGDNGGSGDSGGSGSGSGSLVCGSVNCEATQQKVEINTKAIADALKPQNYTTPTAPSGSEIGDSLNAALNSLKGNGTGNGQGDGDGEGDGDGSGGGGGGFDAIGGGQCPEVVFDIPYLNVSGATFAFCEMMSYIEGPLASIMEAFWLITAFFFLILA